MINLSAKEFLDQIRKADEQINMKQQKIDSLRALAESITSTLKQDVVQTSGTGDNLCNAVAKIVDLDREINDQIDELIDLKEEVRKIVRQIHSSPQRQVIYKKYFRFEPLGQIAAEMGVSYRWVCKLHGYALLEIGKLLDQ